MHKNTSIVFTGCLHFGITLSTTLLLIQDCKVNYLGIICQVCPASDDPCESPLHHSFHHDEISLRTNIHERHSASGFLWALGYPFFLSLEISFSAAHKINLSISQSCGWWSLSRQDTAASKPDLWHDHCSYSGADNGCV